MRLLVRDRSRQNERWAGYGIDIFSELLDWYLEQMHYNEVEELIGDWDRRRLESLTEEEVRKLGG